MSDFVICINNEGNPASLIVGKMIRVVDEDLSKPDGYLYPASMFVPVELPEEAKQVLMAKDRVDHQAREG